MVDSLDRLRTGIAENAELLDMAADEDDEETLGAIGLEVTGLRQEVERLEFRRMFSGEMDASNAFVDIQAGSGGTEAQDWAEMLLRMYLRWAEAHGFATEIIESLGRRGGRDQERDRKRRRRICLRLAAYRDRGPSAGAQVTVRLRQSTHTSFAAVFVSPEIEDDIDIEINPADLRIDVYRASGAGGQHVNRTESAVRITHEPSGIVVQCQNDRSQHKNKATAMKQLRAKLYEMEMQKRRSEAQAVEDTKADIGWGSQIRSYVLDQSRIKDLRTSVEVGNTQAVLDGGLDVFIEASLKQGL